MTLREMHAHLGDLVSEYGDWEAGLYFDGDNALYRVTSVTPNEGTGNPHGHPSFMRVNHEVWPDDEQRGR